MALTVNLAPDGLQPIGNGELIYQFAEDSMGGKTNYRVEIEFNGVTLPIFSYRPDPDGVVVADIATPLRSLLNFTSTRLLDTYVKYQGIWNEGSYSQVDLSGDVISFYLAIQNPEHESQSLSGNNKTLTGLDKLYVFDSEEYNLSNRFSILCDGTLFTAPNTFVIFISNTGEDTLVTQFEGGGGVRSIQDITLQAASLDDVEYGGRIILSNNFPASATVVEVLPVVYVPTCDNLVFLKWVNELGGQSTWAFDYNQVRSHEPAEDGTYKILTAEDNNLSQTEWDLLQWLNRTGAEYGDNEKIGASVQDFTDSSDPINVFVIPRTASVRTKQIRTQFQIDLRYPIVDNIGI